MIVAPSLATSRRASSATVSSASRTASCAVSSSVRSTERVRVAVRSLATAP